MSFESTAKLLYLDQDKPGKATRRIRSFESLKDGWCFGRGLAPEMGTILEAINIATVLESRGFDTEAFPGESGEILISGKSDEDILDITLEGDGEVTIEKNGEELPFSAAENDLLQTVIDMATEISECTTCAFFIISGGTHETISSSILLSNRPAPSRAAAFQSSIRNAPPPQADRYAFTLSDTTQISKLPFFFGDLNATSFRITP